MTDSRKNRFFSPSLHRRHRPWVGGGSVSPQWPLWPLNFVNDGPQNESRNGGHFAEKMQKLDGMLGEVLKKVDELGIADNTMVVLMGDNGCTPTTTSSALAGPPSGRSVSRYSCRSRNSPSPRAKRPILLINTNTRVQ